MCGIAGFLGPTPPPEAAVETTLSVMRQRGPDGLGVFRDTMGGQSLLMMHSRLAIIDLDTRANQPLIDAGAVLVFNGEIYNYLELRDVLQAKGHVFRTEGDSEVLLRGYLEWGEAVVDRLEGMWAFALYDRRRDKLVLSRDPFGEKPLYLLQRPEGLYFGSEVKFLRALSGHRPTVDHAKVRRFLIHGYRDVFKDSGLFHSDIEPLPRASILSLAPDEALARRSNPRPYWRPRYAPLDTISREDAIAAVREWLLKSIEIRMRADTPMALTLSGGVDSNVIAGVAVKHFGLPISTFSMLEDQPDYDERTLIDTAVDWLGAPHRARTVRSAGFLERLGRMTHHYEAPVLSVGMYLEGFLAEEVADAGFKVVINGNGSDEIFAGYYDHTLYWLAGLMGAPELADEVAGWRETVGRFVRNPLFQDPNRFVETPDERRHLSLNAPEIADWLVDPTVAPFREQAFTTDLLRNRMLNELVDETVPSTLFCGDNNWMYHSIENRTAFLDRGLVDLMSRIPSRLLMEDGFSKALLREAARGLVPDEILFARRKYGFNAPIGSLLDRTDPDVREFMLMKNPIFDIIRRDKLEAIMRPDAALDGLDNFLFCVASVKQFYDTQAA